MILLFALSVFNKVTPFSSQSGDGALFRFLEPFCFVESVVDSIDLSCQGTQTRTEPQVGVRREKARSVRGLWRTWHKKARSVERLSWSVLILESHFYTGINGNCNRCESFWSLVEKPGAPCPEKHRLRNTPEQKPNYSK